MTSFLALLNRHLIHVEWQGACYVWSLPYWLLNLMAITGSVTTAVCRLLMVLWGNAKLLKDTIIALGLQPRADKGPRGNDWRV